RGHAHDDIARTSLERVANESAPLRPPRVLHFRMEIPRDEVGQSILESLLALVRERKIVGIGAYAKQLRRRLRRWGGARNCAARSHSERYRRDDNATEA